MTGVTFKGRLGNQLFQFYFFLYLKSKNKNQWFFFPNPHHSYIAKYFNLGIYTWLLNSRLYSVFTRIIAKVIPFRNIYCQNFVAPREPDVSNFTIYNGYFQSDWYLLNTGKPFRLTIKKKYIKQFENIYGNLFTSDKIIAVHIRRTDYLSYGKRDISLPIEYFRKTLNGIKDLETYKVIFLSDDIDFVKLSFPPKENFIFSRESEIIDFQIIQNADIAIISNSTFAWWAAYINKKNAKVFAPLNWLGFRIGREHPKGVMTGRFIWTDVFQ